MSLVIEKARVAAAFAVAAGLIMSVAGCSGSKTTSAGSNVRVFDAVPNGGNATVTLNGNPIVANQLVFAPTFYINTLETAPQIGFTLTQKPATTFPTTAATFAAGSFYTVNLFGRADITDTTDPRYPTAQYTLDDRTSPLSNDTRIRVVNAAPDLGPVDVTVTDSSHNPTTESVATNVAYKSTTAETEIKAGTFPVNVTLTGTSTTVLSPVTYDFLVGHVYTIYVTEQSINPPAYSLVVLDDIAVAPTT